MRHDAGRLPRGTIELLAALLFIVICLLGAVHEWDRLVTETETDLVGVEAMP
jgi:hypothetical protein